MQYLIIVVADEGQLETIFSRIDRNCSRACTPVQTVDGFTLHPREVDWLVECPNDAIISIVTDEEMNIEYGVMTDP